MGQNFFIRKNSELPLLQMKVVNDGRSKYKKIFENLENAAITFSMMDIKTGTYKIFNKPALIIPVTCEGCPEIEYYIGYKFSSKETNKNGTYKGEFKIDFFDDETALIVPIYEDLFINIGDSFIGNSSFC
jgi:hypothetical protein